MLSALERSVGSDHKAKNSLREVDHGSKKLDASEDLIQDAN